MIILQILVLCGLFVLSFFFSGAETILFSLTSTQRQWIKSSKPEADVLIGECLDDSAVLLSTLLIGNTIVNFAIATIGYRLFAELIPAGGIVAVPIMTIGLLVFGEITPKQIALRYAVVLAPTCARLMLFWRKVLAPFSCLLKWSSKAFATGLERERRALSDEELVSVIEAGTERGEFAKEDTQMIEGVLRMSELCANDEMIPRVDMYVYDIDLAEEERQAMIAKSKHRYLPVIRRTPDAIEGVYDCVTGKIEDALFVPETVKLDDLLVTFRKSGKPLAVVLDEYGGTAGIISPDDILELIFGPKVFDNQSNEPLIVRKETNKWIIDGRASLDEVNHELGMELEAEDADRISGWVAYHAERLPHVGQQIEADGCRVTILRRRHRRVELVRLEVLEYPERESDEEMLAETDKAVERASE